MASSSKSNKSKEEEKNKKKKKKKITNNKNDSKICKSVKKTSNNNKSKLTTSNSKSKAKKPKPKSKTNEKEVEVEVEEVIYLDADDDDSSCGIGGGKGKVVMKNSGKKIAPNNIIEKINLADYDDDEEEKACAFPMARVKRIIKSQGIDSLLSQEAVFVVNKASEMFLRQFSENAYDRAVEDRKKSLHYGHVYFVPEKVKAEDALAELKSAEAGPDRTPPSKID
ncbi:hypothetical protein ACFE04_006952 [Oxalis oulophora]